MLSASGLRVFPTNIVVAWRSGSVMDCHAMAQGLIPDGNGIKTELHVQGTVNVGAVSRWPCCRWDVKHNQPSNQQTLEGRLLIGGNQHDLWPKSILPHFTRWVTMATVLFFAMPYGYDDVPCMICLIVCVSCRWSSASWVQLGGVTGESRMICLIVCVSCRWPPAAWVQLSGVTGESRMICLIVCVSCRWSSAAWVQLGLLLASLVWFV